MTLLSAYHSRIVDEPTCAPTTPRRTYQPPGSQPRDSRARGVRNCMRSYPGRHALPMPCAALCAHRAVQAKSASYGAVSSGVAPTAPTSAHTAVQTVFTDRVSRSRCVGPPGVWLRSAIGTRYLISLPTIPDTPGRTCRAIGSTDRRFRK